MKQKPLCGYTERPTTTAAYTQPNAHVLPTLPTSSTHPAHTHQSSIQNVFCTFYTNKPTCTKPLKTWPSPHEHRPAKQVTDDVSPQALKEVVASVRACAPLYGLAMNSRRHIAVCRPKYRSGDGVVCCTLELLPRLCLAVPAA